MIVVLLVLAVVVLFVVAVALSDPAIAARAEQRAAAYLAAPLGPDATLRVHGSPFLTQALRGRYRDVEVRSSGVQLGPLGGTTLQVHLVNAALPLRDLIGRRVSALPVEQVRGTAVIPYAELARVSSLPGLALRFRDGRLVASAKPPLAGFGQLARVSGEAVVTLSAAGAVSVRIRNVSVGGLGLTVPTIVTNQLLPALAFSVPLPRLPYGLRIDRLAPTVDGLQVFASAAEVVFTRLGASARPAG